MRIFFIGCVEFSHKAICHLLDNTIDNVNIVGIGTKKYSNFNADFHDLSNVAIAHNIPYIYIDDINSSDTKAFIDSLCPDVIYCFGWSALIGKKLLESYPIIGFHPAAIPHNRGRHPLIWAMALGLKESASSFFIMDDGADSGALISQVPFSISYFDTAQSLYDKVSDIALDQIESFSKQIACAITQSTTRKANIQNILKQISIPQDLSITNLWRKRGSADGIIDFRMSSYAIYNLIRALGRPYIGAECVYKDSRFKVWSAMEIATTLPYIEPGKVLKVNKDGILIKTYDNAILLVEHECANLPKEGDYLN